MTVTVASIPAPRGRGARARARTHLLSLQHEAAGGRASSRPT